jgi:hypothetical protein
MYHSLVLSRGKILQEECAVLHILVLWITLFVCSLFCDAVSNSDYMALSGWMTVNNK